MSKTERQSGIETVEREDLKVRRPKLYKVILLNDDYTTMDFVVSILENIFKKSPAESAQIMLAVHKQGQGLCGVYPREIAETKVQQVHKCARDEGFPLRSTMEEA